MDGIDRKEEEGEVKLIPPPIREFPAFSSLCSSYATGVFGYEAYGWVLYICLALREQGKVSALSV